MIRSLLILATTVITQNASAFGSHCAGEAQAYAQTYGGTNLTLFRENVNGWYVNSYGDVSYTFNIGNSECYISYEVKGTYFGPLCREFTGFGLNEDRPNCARLGTWTKYKR